MTSGATISGIVRSTRPDSFGLVQIIITTAPRNRTELRKAIETLAPKADFT
jgi:hypothetical protein